MDRTLWLGTAVTNEPPATAKLAYRRRDLMAKCYKIILVLRLVAFAEQLAFSDGARFGSRTVRSALRGYLYG